MSTLRLLSPPYRSRSGGGDRDHRAVTDHCCWPTPSIVLLDHLLWFLLRYDSTHTTRDTATLHLAIAPTLTLPLLVREYRVTVYGPGMEMGIWDGGSNGYLPCGPYHTLVCLRVVSSTSHVTTEYPTPKVPCRRVPSSPGASRLQGWALTVRAWPWFPQHHVLIHTYTYTYTCLLLLHLRLRAMCY